MVFGDGMNYSASVWHSASLLERTGSFTLKEYNQYLQARIMIEAADYVLRQGALKSKQTKSISC